MNFDRVVSLNHLESTFYILMGDHNKTESKILDILQKVQNQKPQSISGCCQNLIWNALLAGKWKQALEYFDTYQEMWDQFTDLTAFYPICEYFAYGAYSNYPESEKLSQIPLSVNKQTLLKALDFLRDLDPKFFTACESLEKYCIENKMPGMYRVLQRMKIDFYQKSGDWKNAFESLQKMTQDSHLSISLPSENQRSSGQ